MLKRKSPSTAGDETSAVVPYAPLKVPVNMTPRLAAFLDTVWEDNEFDQALIMLEGLVGRQHKPQPQHVRQLIALALSPTSCLPDPTKPSSANRAKGKAAAPTTGAEPQTRFLDAPSRDPFASTSRKVRVAALRLLEDISATNSPQAVFRAAPGYSPDPDLLPSLPTRVDRETTPSTSKPQARTTLGLLTPPAEDRSLDVDADDLDFVAAGKRVGRCENMWDLLGGLARRPGKEMPKGPTAARPVVRGGWDVLSTFVRAWEDEVALRRLNGESPISPSFLRQFKTKDVGARDLSQKALDVVFRPFVPLAAPMDDDEEAVHEDDLDAVDEDELNDAEKREVAGRIVALIAQLTFVGKLDHTNAIREFVARLDRLPATSVGQFFESLHSVPIQFTLRLCTSYLDLKSHPSPSSLLPSTASPSRRRTLAAASSSALLDADSQSSTSSAPSIPHFALPTLSALLTALARLPKEVPTADPVEGKRRPAGARRAGWDPAARALKAHQVVKDVLLAGWCEAVGEESEVVKGLLEGAKLEKVRNEFEGRVEEGRRRVESAV